MATTYETERQLQRDISRKVEAALPGVEVLAVELQSPSRFWARRRRACSIRTWRIARAVAANR